MVFAIGILIIGVVILMLVFSESTAPQLPKAYYNQHRNWKMELTGVAKYFVNNDIVDVKLVLTSTQLQFQATAFGKKIFEIAEIQSVDLIRYHSLVKNGILIVINQKEERFIIEYPKDWMSLILHRLNQIRIHENFKYS